MLTKDDIQETAFKFHCEPVDTQSFAEIFQRQAELAADLRNDLFNVVYRAWRDRGFPKQVSPILKEAIRAIRAQYRGKVPDVVMEACIGQVKSQFSNSTKRSKLMRRLELPKFSAKSIPIRSDRGMRFEVIKDDRELVVKVTLALLPGNTKQPAVYLKLKDKSAAEIMRRILNGYQKRKSAQGSTAKELLTDEKSYPPSSAGAVIYDRDVEIFYVSIGYSRPKERMCRADPGRVMAIDVGISSPFTVAFNFGKQPFHMEELGKMIKDLRGEFYRRRRLLQAKFAAAPRKVQKAKLRKLSNAYSGRLKQLMGSTCAYIKKLVEQQQIGSIKVDRPSSKEPTFFTIEFRGERFKVPVLSFVDMLERDLKEMLGENNVESRTFPYSSQICSQCGHWNEYFTWSYRRANNWPQFTCGNCSATMDADINAAQAMLRDDYDQIVATIREKQKKKAELDLGLAVC